MKDPEHFQPASDGRERECRRVEVNDETRLTFRAGLIASFVSAVMIFIMSTLWMHQTSITALQTNQQRVLAVIAKYEDVPTELAKIRTKLEDMSEMQQVQRGISSENNKMLKRERR